MLYLFIIYDVFAEISRSGHSRHAVTDSESHSEPQSYRKSHEKSPRQDRKSDAGGAGLKLVKEFYPIFCYRT